MYNIFTHLFGCSYINNFIIFLTCRWSSAQWLSLACDPIAVGVILGRGIWRESGQDGSGGGGGGGL